MPRQSDPPRSAAPRLRRARRDDIAVLATRVGGPEPGRIRALRRLLKTLTADVYVVDRGATLDGVVAVTYCRSLRHGGLLATIDTLASLRRDAGTVHDIDSLVECAISRARRRGCVAIDSTIESPEVRAALEAQGFGGGAPQLFRPLRPADDLESGEDRQEGGRS